MSFWDQFAPPDAHVIDGKPYIPFSAACKINIMLMIFGFVIGIQL